MDIDSLNVEKSLTLFGEQIKNAWKQGFEAGLPQIKPDGVVISGMGGSSNAAKILEGLCDISVYNDYDLPSWVNQNSLVIANSYSGNTEETISGYEEAKKRGAKIIGISTGGKISDVVIDPKDTNPTGFPKTGLGVSIGALAAVLSKIGILKITEEEIFSAVDELMEIRKNWNAKEMAEWLNGSTPVLFGARPLIGALNAGRNAMCEISRNFTQFYDFPEVDHVLIEATQKPEIAKNNKYLFFISKFNHGRVLTRYEVTEKLFKEQGLDFRNYQLAGSTKLVQALELPHYCAWMAFHLSILQNTDPGPEPWILKLKESLAQPVH